MTGTARRTTAREHVQLRDRFDQLDAAADPAALRAALEALSEELPPHFALEERQDGTFDEIFKALPQSWDALSALREEHTATLAGIEELLARVDVPEPDLDSLRADAQALAEALHRHEAVESQLMEDAAYVEYGVAD